MTDLGVLVNVGGVSVSLKKLDNSVNSELVNIIHVVSSTMKPSAQPEMLHWSASLKHLFRFPRRRQRHRHAEHHLPHLPLPHLHHLHLRPRHTYCHQVNWSAAILTFLSLNSKSHFPAQRNLHFNSSRFLHQEFPLDLHCARLYASLDHLCVYPQHANKR